MPITAGLTPQQAFDWRKNPARRNLQAGRQIFTQTARGRRHRRHPPREGQGDAYGKLDQKALGKEAVQACLRRARQQACTDRLGRTDPEGSLSILCSAGLRSSPDNPNSRIGHGSR